MVKPLALVVFEPGERAEFLHRALETGGWAVAETMGGWPKANDAIPALIVFDSRNTNAILDLEQDAAASRWIASVPRLAIGATASELPDACDLVVSETDDVQLAEVLKDWRPPANFDALDRIAAALGVEGVTPVVSGLRRELEKAVAELDAGRHDMAHRVAGLAGTLGFQPVSAVWNALSHGDSTLAPDARREARIAMAAIDRWLIRAAAM